MNPSDSLVSIATLIACLSLVSCRESSSKDSVSDHMATPPERNTAPEPATAREESPQQPASLQQEIIDLKREIQSREQTIEDLDAAVAMERAKLDENPDYDQSFLDDVLNEQDQERLEIEKVQIQLDTLTR